MASPSSSPSPSPSPPTPPSPSTSQSPTSTSQTTVSTVHPTPQWQDKKWRAKNAKVTIGRIPKLLKASARAQAGIDRTELIPYTPSLEPGKPMIPTTNPKPKPTHPKITVQKSDTFDAAFQLLASIQSHQSQKSANQSTSTSTFTKQKKSSSSSSSTSNNKNKNKRVAVLNMASALQPGGGVLNGSQAQEESLCTRSTLYYSLLTQSQSYRLPELSAIYSPDILVFRGSTPFESKILAREDWRFVDVISVAAVKGPDVEVVEVVRDGGRRDENGDERGKDGGGENVKRMIYASERDKEAMVLKIRLILQVARLKGITHLVLGAFGCGAYRNPVREVAEIFKRVILGDGKRRGGAGTGIEEIVFAIFDEGENLRVFREVFEGLDMEESDTDVEEV